MFFFSHFLQLKTSKIAYIENLNLNFTFWWNFTNKIKVDVEGIGHT
jgi:hypothetical protein